MTIAFEHGGNIFAVARQMGISPEEILDFSASINPLGPAPGVGEAITAALPSIVHYPESQAPELQRALAQRYGLAEENVCVTNGSTESIYLLTRLVVGERALVVAPAFSEYAKALGRDRWGVDYFVLRHDEGFHLRLEALEEKLTEGYDLLVIGNPGNPTGRLYSQAEIHAVASLCAEHGAFLVVDEAFMEFCEEGSVKGLAAENPRMLVLRSLTKFYALPGLRLGWVAGVPSTIARLAALREPWSVNMLAQAAGLASLEDRAYALRSRELTALWRQAFVEDLSALPGLTVYPSAANYLLLRLAEPIAATVSQRLAEERMLVRQCANFVGLDDHFLRLAVRGVEDNGRLAAALGRALTLP
jgi:threonine-phosphate decarboxylase